MVKRRDFMKRYVFGKSVKGATHEKNGLPLQDNCKIEEISDKITIIAVWQLKVPQKRQRFFDCGKYFLHSNEKLSAQLWKRKGWSYESGNISEQRRRYALRTGHM